MTRWSEDLLALVRWAVFGDEPPAHGQLTDDKWQLLLRDARQQRMTGMLAAVEGIAETLPPTRGEELAHLEHEWALHTLRAEEATVRSVGLLRSAGIDVRVLKGSVLAHRHWPAPHLRVFGDADLLVRSDDLGAAVDAIRDAGGERPLPEVRSGFDRRFSKSVTMLDTAGVEIDFHRTLVAGPHTFLVPEADLWEPGEEVVVAGATLQGLPTPALVVHAAAHAVASRAPRLANLLDLAFTAEHADLDEASQLAERWKLGAVVREAGRRLETALGRPHPAISWALDQPASGEEERLLSVLTHGTYRAAAWASVPFIEGRIDRLRFFASLALPSRAHRRAR